MEHVRDDSRLGTLAPPCDRLPALEKRAQLDMVCIPPSPGPGEIPLESVVTAEFTVVREGTPVKLDIKTADEFVALDLEGRWRARRASRETRLSRQILRLFLDRGGPIPVAQIVAASDDGSPDAVQQALVALDGDDLIRIRDGMVDIAYPFSASPTPFVVRVGGGSERYACCAMDALGIAPMTGRRVEILSRCHHCADPLAFSATPHGQGTEAEGIMLWIGKRPEDDRCKVADSL